jgi:hypothetical protein
VANRAPRNSTSANTDGRKAKKQGMHGMSDDGRNPDLRTMVRESLSEEPQYGGRQKF